MTEEAYQAALNLMDPFPDTALAPVGWPSSYNGNTVPSVMTKYVDVAAPPTTNSTWCFKVMYLPLVSSYLTTDRLNWDTGTGVLTGSVNVNYPVGQFNIWKWKSEDPEPNIWNKAADATFSIDPDARWSRIRLCAAGFEAINTSAELYKGGMQYGWRNPNYLEPVQYDLTAPSPNLVVKRRQILAGIPADLNEVVNLNTTFSGPAHNGIGVFSLPSSSANPSVPTMPTALYIVNPNTTTSNFLGSAGNTSAAFDWMPCGATFTGLAKEATFAIKMRCFYELIPTVDSTSFIQSIAHTPTPHSFILEEMIDRVLQTMPSGFDYSENPLGEWLHKVLGLLAHAAVADRITKMLYTPKKDASDSVAAALTATSLS